MHVISRDNKNIKLFRKLLTSGTVRRELHLFACEGARLCADAALSGVKIQKVIYTGSAAQAYPEQFRLLESSGAEMLEISGELAAKIGDTSTPQGIFCIAEWLDNQAGLNKIEKVISRGGFDMTAVALERIQDPSNMGAIIRTAEAFGIDALFLSDDCCDIYNPKVLRGSMGGIFRLPICTVGGMTGAVRGWRSCGIRCYACVVDGGATPVTAADLNRGCICVIGNEGSGLCDDTAAACDDRITIPMGGRAESLNASMAAGIVMWEMTKL